MYDCPLQQAPFTYKFTGKERGSESNLDNFGARYNSSSTGRFMSPDPLWVKVDRMLDPQRLNLYAYVRNNPLRLTDATGMDVTIGNCPHSTTMSACFSAIQQGLRKEDRSHVHLVSGDDKNGFKKGTFGITVDKDYKSESGNFSNLQRAANDHSAMAVANFEPSGFLIQGRAGALDSNGNVRLESLTKYAGTEVRMGQGLDGFTLEQQWGQPHADWMYSTKPETEMLALSDTVLYMTVNFYHELVHVVLGDFGRSQPAGWHNAPGVNAATKAAEEEATKNAEDK